MSKRRRVQLSPGLARAVAKQVEKMKEQQPLVDLIHELGKRAGEHVRAHGESAPESGAKTPYHKKRHPWRNQDLRSPDKRTTSRMPPPPSSPLQISAINATKRDGVWTALVMAGTASGRGQASIWLDAVKLAIEDLTGEARFMSVGDMLVLSRLLGLLDEAMALLPGPHFPVLAAGVLTEEHTECMCSPCIFRRGYKARVKQILNDSDAVGSPLTESEAFAFKVNDLELSVRAANGLFTAGRLVGTTNETLGDVVSFLRGKPLRLAAKHVGKKTEMEIRAELERVGVPLSVIIRIVPAPAAERKS